MIFNNLVFGSIRIVTVDLRFVDIEGFEYDFSDLINSLPALETLNIELPHMYSIPEVKDMIGYLNIKNLNFGIRLCSTTNGEEFLSFLQNFKLESLVSVQNQNLNLFLVRNIHKTNIKRISVKLPPLTPEMIDEIIFSIEKSSIVEFNFSSNRRIVEIVNQKKMVFQIQSHFKLMNQLKGDMNFKFGKSLRNKLQTEDETNPKKKKK